MEAIVLTQIEAFPTSLQLERDLPLRTALLHLGFPRLIDYLIGKEDVDVNALDLEGRTAVDAVIARYPGQGDISTGRLFLSCAKLIQRGGLLRTTTKAAWDRWWLASQRVTSDQFRMQAEGMPRWLPGSPGQPVITRLISSTIRRLRSKDRGQSRSRG